jgi:hypothetical protein
MNEEFYRQILDKQQQAASVPSNKEITAWALQVIRLLYPEQAKKVFFTLPQLQEEFAKLQTELCQIMAATRECSNCDNDKIAKSFFDGLPDQIYRPFLTETRLPAASLKWYALTRVFMQFLFIAWHIGWLNWMCPCCRAF